MKRLSIENIEKRAPVEKMKIEELRREVTKWRKVAVKAHNESLQFRSHADEMFKAAWSAVMVQGGKVVIPQDISAQFDPSTASFSDGFDKNLQIEYEAGTISGSPESR